MKSVSLFAGIGGFDLALKRNAVVVPVVEWIVKRLAANA